MKRYLLFSYENEGAFGGVNDYFKDFDNLKSIYDFIHSLNYATSIYWDILDIKSKTHFQYSNKSIILELIKQEESRIEAYELLKVLTFLKIHKDIRRLIYEKCLFKSSYNFTPLVDALGE